MAVAGIPSDNRAFGVAAGKELPEGIYKIVLVVNDGKKEIPLYWQSSYSNLLLDGVVLVATTKRYKDLKDFQVKNEDRIYQIVYPDPATALKVRSLSNEARELASSYETALKVLERSSPSSGSSSAAIQSELRPFFSRRKAYIGKLDEILVYTSSFEKDEKKREEYFREGRGILHQRLWLSKLFDYLSIEKQLADKKLAICTSPWYFESLVNVNSIYLELFNFANLENEWGCRAGAEKDLAYEKLYLDYLLMGLAHYAEDVSKADSARASPDTSLEEAILRLKGKFRTYLFGMSQQHLRELFDLEKNLQKKVPAGKKVVAREGANLLYFAVAKGTAASIGVRDLEVDYEETVAIKISDRTCKSVNALSTFLTLQGPKAPYGIYASELGKNMDLANRKYSAIDTSFSYDAFLTLQQLCDPYLKSRLFEQALENPKPHQQIVQDLVLSPAHPVFSDENAALDSAILARLADQSKRLEEYDRYEDLMAIAGKQVDPNLRAQFNLNKCVAPYTSPVFAATIAAFFVIGPLAAKSTTTAALMGAGGDALVVHSVVQLAGDSTKTESQLWCDFAGLVIGVPTSYNVAKLRARVNDAISNSKVQGPTLNKLRGLEADFSARLKSLSALAAKPASYFQKVLLTRFKPRDFGEPTYCINPCSTGMPEAEQPYPGGGYVAPGAPPRSVGENLRGFFAGFGRPTRTPATFGVFLGESLLFQGHELVIGRANGQIRLADNAISGTHGVVRGYNDGTFWYQHHGNNPFEIATLDSAGSVVSKIRIDSESPAFRNQVLLRPNNVLEFPGVNGEPVFLVSSGGIRTTDGRVFSFNRPVPKAPPSGAAAFGGLNIIRTVDGQESQILPNTLLRVGRSSDSHILLDDPLVSRAQGELFVAEDGSLSYRDLSTTNPPEYHDPNRHEWYRYTPAGVDPRFRIPLSNGYKIRFPVSNKDPARKTYDYVILGVEGLSRLDGTPLYQFNRMRAGPSREPVQRHTEENPVAQARQVYLSRDMPEGSAAAFSAKNIVNEDAFFGAKGLFQGNQREIYAVFDGVSGLPNTPAAEKGSYASKIAKDTFNELFQSGRIRNEDDVVAALAETSARIKAQYPGAQTTATVVLVSEEGVFVASIGDSRAYLVRGNTVEQLTVDDGVLFGVPEAEVYAHPNKNVIHNALGSGSRGIPKNKVKRLHLEDGDVILLTSDGVHDIVTRSEISRIFASFSRRLHDFVSNLIFLAHTRPSGTEHTSPEGWKITGKTDDATAAAFVYKRSNTSR